MGKQESNLPRPLRDRQTNQHFWACTRLERDNILEQLKALKQHREDIILDQLEWQRAHGRTSTKLAIEGVQLIKKARSLHKRLFKLDRTPPASIHLKTRPFRVPALEALRKELKVTTT